MQSRTVCTALCGLILTLTLRLPTSRAQDIGDLEYSPKERVEQLWAMAVRGELLTLEGRARTSGFFPEPNLDPSSKNILVRSNYYAVAQNSDEGDRATIDMGFTDVGQIDPHLRYFPPKPTTAYQTAIRYKLVTVPRRIVFCGPDGKTKVGDRVIPGTHVWMIDGSLDQPWTTVNTAIRYLLEKTKDSELINNANRTLDILKTLH
jgi:hypothetical protein